MASSDLHRRIKSSWLSSGLGVGSGISVAFLFGFVEIKIPQPLLFVCVLLDLIIPIQTALGGKPAPVRDLQFKLCLGAAGVFLRINPRPARVLSEHRHIGPDTAEQLHHVGKQQKRIPNPLV